jgi:hypothetical protein
MTASEPITGIFVSVLSLWRAVFVWVWLGLQVASGAALALYRRKA